MRRRLRQHVREQRERRGLRPVQILEDQQPGTCFAARVERRHHRVEEPELLELDIHAVSGRRISEVVLSREERGHVVPGGLGQRLERAQPPSRTQSLHEGLVWRGGPRLAAAVENCVPVLMGEPRQVRREARLPHPGLAREQEEGRALIALRDGLPQLRQLAVTTGERAVSQHLGERGRELLGCRRCGLGF
jgi:hypothetical protein